MNVNLDSNQWKPDYNLCPSIQLTINFPLSCCSSVTIRKLPFGKYLGILKCASNIYYRNRHFTIYKWGHGGLETLSILHKVSVTLQQNQALSTEYWLQSLYFKLGYCSASYLGTTLFNRSQQIFSIQGQIVNIVGFLGHTVSAITA